MTNKVVIIPLPNPRPDRAAPDLDAGPASVRAFPIVADRRVVEGIVDEMQSKPTRLGAEDVLAAHLELEIFRFMRLDVSEPEIERTCREFARAAWVAFDRAVDAFGAA